MVVATAEGGLSLTFIPKLKEGASPLLATPLTLKGTAEELEQGIAAALEAIQSKRETLAETVEAAQAVIAQATKDAAAAATAKKAGKLKAPNAATPAASTLAPTSADDDEGQDDEDQEDDGTADTSPAADTPSAPTGTASAAPALNLFA